MNKTQNFGMSLPDLSNNADINVLNENFSTIDNGLTPFFSTVKSADNIYKVSTGLNKASIENGYCIRVAILESSTGPVSVLLDTITVPVKKSGGGSVSNFKANSVYTLTYYNSVFILTSSGGGDDVNFTSDKLLQGYTANNSDGEKVSGSMQNNGTVTQNMSVNGHITLPKGYYDSININQSITTKGGSTYTPGTSNQVISGGQYLTGDQIILGDGNLRAENIKEGISIFGVNGIANALSLNGLRMASGSSDTTTEKANATYYNVFLSINCEFEPKLIICEPNFDYNRCRFLFATTLFDGSKIYSQEWQGTSSDATKTQIVTLIKDYTPENIKKLKIGTIRSDTRTTVRWFAFG